MIHDIGDYLKAEEEQAIMEGLAGLGKYGFSEQLFTKNRFAGTVSGENRIIDHTTFYATAVSALEEDLHDVQVYANTHLGFEPGFSFTGASQIEDVRDYILGVMQMGMPVVTDIETGIENTLGLEGLPETDDEVLRFLDSVSALGYEHDFVQGQEYRRAFDWGSCEIVETQYHDGHDNMISIEVYETTRKGRRQVAEKIFSNEYDSIQSLDKIMKVYDMGMSVTTQPIGTLRQKLVWRHSKGFKEIPLERGAGLTQENVDNLRELYNAKRLYLGDKDHPIPAHHILASFDELIK